MTPLGRVAEGVSSPKVFVIDKEGKPLLPTHPARARKLLNSGRAKVKRVVPFTIQLTRVIENPIGSFKLGLDDGAKFVGVAVVNYVTQETVFQGAIKLRQDVSQKILSRAQFRRTRRGRNCRHRQARFLNRKQQTPFPSIRQRKESIVRVVDDLKNILNLTECVVEQGELDVSSLSAGRQLKGAEYQQCDFEGKNFRAKVLWRDKYTCQRCGNNQSLQAHHIVWVSKGGTSTPNNGITLCKKCHDTLHKGQWILEKKPKIFKYPMHLMQGKHYLVSLLEQAGLSVETCVGWQTSSWRRQIGLEKSHFSDAIAMIVRDYKPKICSLIYTVIPKRVKVWEDNPTKKQKEKFGFRHYDLVLAKHRTKGYVVGSVRSLKAKVMTLRTTFDDNFSVSYRKSRLLSRFSRIIYLY